MSMKLIASQHGQMYLRVKNLAMELVRHLHEQGNLSYNIVIENRSCNRDFRNAPGRICKVLLVCSRQSMLSLDQLLNHPIGNSNRQAKLQYWRKID